MYDPAHIAAVQHQIGAAADMHGNKPLLSVLLIAQRFLIRNFIRGGIVHSRHQTA